MSDDKLAAALERLEDLIKVQCSDGNWNYGPYMHGLANGLLVAKAAITEDYTIKTLDAPAVWLEQLSPSLKDFETPADGNLKLTKLGSIHRNNIKRAKNDQ